MSELLGSICFSNAALRCVKRIFFHRFVLWSVGAMFAFGLILSRVFGESDRTLAIGLLLCAPLILWVALLAVISSILIVPRLAMIGLATVAFYFDLHSVVGRLAHWAANYDDSRNGLQQRTLAANPQQKAAQPWSEYGGFFLTILFIVLAYVWPKLPDLIWDTVAVTVLIYLAAIFGWQLISAIRVNGGPRYFGYFGTALVLTLASLAAWNFIALYTSAGTAPVTFFGRNGSARPSFYVIPIVVIALLWAAFRRLRDNKALSGERVATDLGSDQELHSLRDVHDT